MAVESALLPFASLALCDRTPSLRCLGTRRGGAGSVVLPRVEELRSDQETGHVGGATSQIPVNCAHICGDQQQRNHRFNHVYQSYTVRSERPAGPHEEAGVVFATDYQRGRWQRHDLDLRRRLPSAGVGPLYERSQSVAHTARLMRLHVHLEQLFCNQSGD